MPEWLRLFSKPIKNVGSNITKGAALSGTRSVPSVMESSLLRVPTSSSFSTTPHLTTSSLLALPSEQKAYITPQVTPASNDAIRTLTRRSVGLPDDQTVPDYMSTDQLRHLLDRQMHHPIDNEEWTTLNQGIEPGYPGYIGDFRSLLNNAISRYYSRIDKTPYVSFDEALADKRLFNNYGYYDVPIRALTPLAEDYISRGLGLPSGFSRYQKEITKNMLNAGKISESHPFVQGYMADYSLNLPEKPEDFMEEFGHLTGSDIASENSERSAMKLWPLVTRSVVPGSKKEKQIQLTYGNSGKTILDWDKYRTLLDKIENIESLPDRERTWLKGIIDQAYIPPYKGSFDDLEPWQMAKVKRFSDAAKRIYGIDVTPDDLLNLYDVRSSSYPELAKRVRKGMEILPGDLQHFNWFQVRNAKEAGLSGVNWSLPVFRGWTPTQREAFAEKAKQNEAQLREKEAQTMVGLQEAALSHALPTETANAEQHTSPDSFRIGVKKAGKSSNYGTSPGQIEMVQIPTRGDFLRQHGNNFQLNRVHYDINGDLVSDLKIPEIEKHKFNKDEMEKLLQDIRYFNSGQLKTYMQLNPNAASLIDRAISVAKLLHDRDLKNVRPAFELVNRKHRKLGLPEIPGPGENDFPMLTTDENFYNEDNVKNVITLLKEMDRASRYRGFALHLDKRTPYIILQHQQGGKL